MKFAPKKSVPKWTSRKMGNAKKGYNKMGLAKKMCFPILELLFFWDWYFCERESIGSLLIHTFIVKFIMHGTNIFVANNTAFLTSCHNPAAYWTS